MNPDTANQLFDLGMVLLNMAGVCMTAHFALLLALRVAARGNDPSLSGVFSFSTFGWLLTRRPWLIEARYFLPWVRSPAELSSRGRFIYLIFVAARIAGAGTAIGFIGWLAMMIYIGIRAA